MIHWVGWEAAEYSNLLVQPSEPLLRLIAVRPALGSAARQRGRPRLFFKADERDKRDEGDRVR